MKLTPLASCFVLLGLGSLSLAASACSSSGDDESGTAESAKRVKPKGNEDYTTGTVTVTVPSNSPTLLPTSGYLVDQAKKVAAIPFKLNEQVTAPIGTYDVRFYHYQYTDPFATVDVVGGQQSTVNFSVLDVVPVTASTPPAQGTQVQFDYGPPALPLSGDAHALSISFENGNLTYDSPIQFPNTVRGGVVLAPNTTYTLYQSQADLTKVKLDELVVGSKAKVYTLGPYVEKWSSTDMQVPSKTLNVTLAGSDFPASPLSVIWSCSAAQSDAAHNYKIGPTYDVKSLTDGKAVQQKSVSGKLLADPACNYSIALETGTLALDLTKASLDVDVEYIDVDDVELDHTGGGVRTVPGTYRISKILGPGQAPQPLTTTFVHPTKTAVAVVPGTYLVEVSYQDNVGSKIYSNQVTVP